jgi:hypothetical protein
MQSIRSVSFLRQSLLKSNKLRLLLIPVNNLCKNSDYFNPVSNEPQIPSAVNSKPETIEVKRARLLYQSRKRGIIKVFN